MRVLGPALFIALFAEATVASAQGAPPPEAVHQLEVQGRFEEAVDALELAALDRDAAAADARAWLERALVYRTAGDDVAAATRAVDALGRAGAPRGEVAAWEMEVAAMHDRTGRWRDGARAREEWLRRWAAEAHEPAGQTASTIHPQLIARAREERCLAWDRVDPDGPLTRCPTSFSSPHLEQFVGSVDLPLDRPTSNLASVCFFPPYGALGGGAGGGPSGAMALLTSGHPGPQVEGPWWPRSYRTGDALGVGVTELFRDDLRISALAGWVLRRAGRTIDSLTRTWLRDTADQSARGRSPTRLEVRALDRALGYHFTARWLLGGAAPSSEIYRQWALLAARLGAWSQAWLATHPRPVWNAGQLTWPEAVLALGQRMEAERANALARCAEHAQAEHSLLQMRRCDEAAGRAPDGEVLPPSAALGALQASIERPLPTWSAVHIAVLE